MSGYEFRDKKCFSNVYFTGIVRDKLGRKMSKQLGNSPDPIELMNKYGADGVRMGLMLAAPAGNDILFDENLCEQGRNFCNKIWNAFRLVNGWEVDNDMKQPNECKIIIEWFDAKLWAAWDNICDLFDKYRISEALMETYKLFWDDFCAWYLEMIKPEYGKPIDKYTFRDAIEFFNVLLKFLHPFMPFITEELYHALEEERKENESIMNAQIKNKPKKNDGRVTFLIEFEEIKEIIANIRNIRQQKNISPKESLLLFRKDIFETSSNSKYDEIIKKLGNISKIENVTEKSAASVSFLVGTTEYFVPVEINVEEEIAKMETEIKYLQGFRNSVQVKLSNEKFVSNAKPEVVENERKKLADAESKIKSLEEGINQLKG
jgi:valyl-tRNA synthetase